MHNDSLTSVAVETIPECPVEEDLSHDIHESQTTGTLSVPQDGASLRGVGGANNRRRRSFIDSASKLSGRVSHFLKGRPRGKEVSGRSFSTPSENAQGYASRTSISIKSESSQSAPLPPPPPLEPPTLRELGLSLREITPHLNRSRFPNVPSNGVFLAPHFLLLCHSQGLDVLPVNSPPASLPYALIRRVAFKSIIVMEERGALVAIAGRRNAVRVYALEDVRKAVEWRLQVEVQRQSLEQLKREKGKRPMSTGIERWLGIVPEPMDPSTDNRAKALAQLEGSVSPNPTPLYSILHPPSSSNTALNAAANSQPDSQSPIHITDLASRRQTRHRHRSVLAAKAEWRQSDSSMDEGLTVLENAVQSTSVPRENASTSVSMEVARLPLTPRHPITSRIPDFEEAAEDSALEDAITVFQALAEFEPEDGGSTSVGVPNPSPMEVAIDLSKSESQATRSRSMTHRRSSLSREALPVFRPSADQEVAQQHLGRPPHSSGGLESSQSNHERLIHRRSSHRVLSRVLPNVFRRASVSQPMRTPNQGEPETTFSRSQPQGSALPAPKLEYVKLPGTKGALMIKAIETPKKSFLAILCGESGEKVELFAGTYRTTLGLSRTFILPDSPQNLELQLQGDDLVEMFLVFRQNVFGLEPATVRVREVRLGREERRAQRRRVRESYAGPGNTELSIIPQDPADIPQSRAHSGFPEHPSASVTTEAFGPSGPAKPAMSALGEGANTLKPYTTFQQLSFAPQFPLGTIADDCIIPPSYPSVLRHRMEFETTQNDRCPPYQPFAPPGLPVPTVSAPCKWHYKDPKGIVQGPWKASLMQSWFQDGLLPLDLPVRREGDEEFTLLKDLRQMCLDPTRPFHPPVSPGSQDCQQLSRPHPAESLLPPVSLLTQPRQYGPPALFFTSRGGHSTSIVDVRGKPVLKGRFMWTQDDDDNLSASYDRLGDIKRIEIFDFKDKVVIMALRQTGIEIANVADGLHQLEDTTTSASAFSSSRQSRRKHFVYQVGSEIPDGTWMLPSSQWTPGPNGMTTSTSYTPRSKPERHDKHEHHGDQALVEDELLFLGRDQETVYLCERSRTSFRFLRLFPSNT